MTTSELATSFSGAERGVNGATMYERTVCSGVTMIEPTVLMASMEEVVGEAARRSSLAPGYSAPSGRAAPLQYM